MNENSKVDYIILLKIIILWREITHLNDSSVSGLFISYYKLQVGKRYLYNEAILIESDLKNNSLKSIHIFYHFR